MSEYPEHDKLTAVKDESQAIGEFIDCGGYTLCKYRAAGNNGQPRYIWSDLGLSVLGKDQLSKPPTDRDARCDYAEDNPAFDCSPHYRASPPSRRKHREDGWPLCPQCGEDELYSLADPPAVETIVGCYRCGPSAQCTCTPKGNPSVIGACACDVHGMKALRAALGRMVDLYRHPDGSLILEPGSSEMDDALSAAAHTLGMAT